MPPQPARPPQKVPRRARLIATQPRTARTARRGGSPGPDKTAARRPARERARERRLSARTSSPRRCTTHWSCPATPRRRTPAGESASAVHAPERLRDGEERRDEKDSSTSEAAATVRGRSPPPLVERAVTRASSVPTTSHALKHNMRSRTDEPPSLERPHVPANTPKGSASPRTSRRRWTAAYSPHEGDDQAPVHRGRTILHARRQRAIRRSRRRRPCPWRRRRAPRCARRDKRGVEPAGAARSAARSRHELVARGHAPRPSRACRRRCRAAARRTRRRRRARRAPGHLRRAPPRARSRAASSNVGDGRLHVVVAERAAGVSSPPRARRRRRLGRRRGELADLALVSAASTPTSAPGTWRRVLRFSRGVLERAPRRPRRTRGGTPAAAGPRAGPWTPGPVGTCCVGRGRRSSPPRGSPPVSRNNKPAPSAKHDPIRIVARPW